MSSSRARQLRRGGQSDKALLADVCNGDAGAVELVVPQLFDSLEVERLLVDAHAAQDLAEDPPGWPAVETRCDGLIADVEGRYQAVNLCQDVGALQVGRLGQDHIGEPACLRIAHVDGDEQREMLHGALGWPRDRAYR